MKICKRGHEHSDKQCLICHNETRKRWQIANKEHVAKVKKRYNQINKTKITKYQAAYMNSYAKQRRKVDVLYRLASNIRSLISHSFRDTGYSKSSKTQVILGCDFDTLQSHLIASAIKNYGKYFPKRPYEIDHVIPISSAKSEEELIKLNHYTNLQFLYPKDNRYKSDKPLS